MYIHFVRTMTINNRINHFTSCAYVQGNNTIACCASIYMYTCIHVHVHVNCRSVTRNHIELEHVQSKQERTSLIHAWGGARIHASLTIPQYLENLCYMLLVTAVHSHSTDGWLNIMCVYMYILGYYTYSHDSVQRVLTVVLCPSGKKTLMVSGGVGRWDCCW